MTVHNQVFSNKEYKNREKILLDKLEDIELSFVFNRPDLYYYSGSGLDGILSVDDKITRYVKRNADTAKQLTDLETYPMHSFRLFKDLAKNTKVNKIGLELDILPYKTVSYIKKAFNSEIVDIGPLLRDIRSVKSIEEQEILKKAAKQTDDSFDYIRDFIKPGVTEMEISTKIESFLRREGHPGYNNIRNFQHNFTTQAYVMAGENTQILNTSFGPVSGVGICNMHMNGPSYRKIKNNEAVLIDTTGVYEGYTADETITFFVGKPDKNLIDAYEVAKDVHRLAEKILIEGNLASDIYNEMIDLVSNTEFKLNFMGKGDDKVGFIGHGIGLELDELPIITPNYSKKLIAGQVIALEPKFILKRSGVGLEQDYIVGKNSAERITNFDW